MIVNENTGGETNTGYGHDFGAIWTKFNGVFNENDQLNEGNKLGKRKRRNITIRTILRD